MKSLILTLTLLIPFSLKSQQYKQYGRYDAEKTAKHIMSFHIRHYLCDTVEWINNDKTTNLLSNNVESKILKLFRKGNTEFTSQTNAGYSFTISVVSAKDDTKIFYYITFRVDQDIQKVNSIEVTKGD
jgi:hypothetical protein